MCIHFITFNQAILLKSRYLRHLGADGGWGQKSPSQKHKYSPAFFYAAHFLGLQTLFWAIKLLLQSPASCVCVSAATQVSPKLKKRL